MKLSIVTINYNNAEGLKRTLDSVKSQTCQEFEHIIIDGASTDDSVRIIESYVRDVSCMIYDVLWVSEKDKGIYHAMNKGIRKATGKYIQILNSGDILASADVIEQMFAALDYLNDKRSSLNEDAVGILYGNMLKAYPDGRIVRDTCGNAMYTPESFLYFYKGTLNHDCAYIRRDLFEKYGLYNEQMKICSDWEWYVRAIVIGGEKPIYTNIDVTIFDMNGVSENGRKNSDLIKQERRTYLESILPASVLRDYDAYAFPIRQYQRLKRHHIWGVVHLLERILFKLEKWKVIH